MSRSRIALAALLIPVAAGAVAVLGAGSASASIFDGDYPVKFYNGQTTVMFDQGQTQFLSDVNAGAVVDILPKDLWSVQRSFNGWAANDLNIGFDQGIDLAAAEGSGFVLAFNDPAITGLAPIVGLLPGPIPAN